MDKLLITDPVIPQFAQGLNFSTGEYYLSTGFKEALLDAVLPGVPKQALDGRVEAGIELEHLLYFLARMHHRRVVPAAELNADFGGGILGDLPDDVHGHLPG